MTTPDNFEIERKFLLKAPPPDTAFEIYKVTQGYLMIDNGKVLRVTEDIEVDPKTRGVIETTYWQTYKFSGMHYGAASRKEYEFPLTPSQGKEQLQDQCITDIIKKTRYWLEYKHNPDLIWEVDQFHSKNKGLFVVEIEIPTEDYELTLPPWIGKEVTDDKRFSNVALSYTPFSTWSKAEKEEAMEWQKNI